LDEIAAGGRRWTETAFSGGAWLNVNSTGAGPIRVFSVRSICVTLRIVDDDLYDAVVEAFDLLAD